MIFNQYFKEFLKFKNCICNLNSSLNKQYVEVEIKHYVYVEAKAIYLRICRRIRME